MNILETGIPDTKNITNSKYVTSKGIHTMCYSPWLSADIFLFLRYFDLQKNAHRSNFEKIMKIRKTRDK